MKDTNEAYERYAKEYGPCNRVVFDAAYRMGREDKQPDYRTDRNELRDLLTDLIAYTRPCETHEQQGEEALRRAVEMLGRVKG